MDRATAESHVAVATLLHELERITGCPYSYTFDGAEIDKAVESILAGNNVIEVDFHRNNQVTLKLKSE